MKINLVLGHQLGFPPVKGGGVENLNWMLAKEYARKGHAVVAYSRLRPGLARTEVDEQGIRHVRIRGYDLHPNLWLDHLNALRYGLRLWPALEAADVTTFHTPFSFFLRHKKRLGICTHTIHRTPKWIVRFYSAFDRLYCGSDAVIQQALAIYPRLRNLKRIYNCIAVLPDPPPFRKRDGVGLTLMYVGRFVPDKGLQALIEGFHRSLAEFPDNRLVTVGPQLDEDGADSRFFSAMGAYIAANHLDKKIELLPPVYDRSKLDALVGAADIVCVPTITGETFSMAILEAMAQGKPILTSDFPPMLEAIDDRVTGYVTRRGDPESVAEAVRCFSRLGPGLEEMSRAAFRKVQECFSADRIADEYLADFRSLILQRTLIRQGH